MDELISSEADNCSEVSRGVAVADGVVGRIGCGEDATLACLEPFRRTRPQGVTPQSASLTAPCRKRWGPDSPDPLSRTTGAPELCFRTDTESQATRKESSEPKKLEQII